MSQEHSQKDLREEIGRLKKSLSDITLKAEMVEKAYREKIDILTNALPIALFVVQNEKIIFANQAYYDIEKKLKGQDLLASMLELCNKLLNNPIENKNSVIHSEYSYNLSDNTKCWFQIFLADTIIENENACIGYMEEITEKKQNEEKHARLQEQFQHSQRMESIGTLAGGVAHDFNNILMVILGHVESIKRRIKPENEFYEELNIVSDAGNRAANLTKKLLAFSRKQIFNPEILNINSLIKYQVQMAKRLIGEDITLMTALNDDLPNIKADPSQIEQVLLNLIVNAKDAIQENQNGNPKIIEIRTKLVSKDENQFLKHKDSYEFIELIVSDTGSGMEENMIDKIFEPFFTTKEVGKGSGLGLSMVYGIIKQNDGEIFVTSEVGKGTKVSIYWPVLSKEDKGLEEIVTYSGPAIKGQEYILLVEDDKSVRQFLRTALTELGYTVYFAQNGAIAVEIFKEYANKINLIITDIVMPEMNGKELADKVKRINANVKILFTSGYSEEQISAKGALSKDTSYLQKPFTISTLSRMIRDVLEE